MLTCTTTSINVTATGGGTYTWSGGSATNTAANTFTATGAYTVTVTGANGCTSTSGITITSNTTHPTANAGPDQNITCANPSTQLDGSASSTGANYTYSWSGNLVSGTGTLTPTVNQVGTYNLTVTDITNGCTSTDAAVVTSTAPIPVANAGTDKTITCTSTSVILDGSASSTGANYTYTWSGTLVSGLGTLTPTVNQAGTYTLTVTDTTNGCSSVDNVLVTLNTTVPTANAGPDKNITCANPSTQLDGSASSTGANYTYSWSGTLVSGNGTLNPTVDQPDTYTLTVTDKTNGCSASNDVAVNNVNGPSFSGSNFNDATCNQDNGGATVTVTGGTLPYTFSWNSTPPQSSQTLINVPGGTYTVTVKDAGGCVLTKTFVIAQILPPKVTTSSTPDHCDMGNGSVTASATQGSGTYTYQWNTPNNDVTSSVSNLSSGSYLVTVNDGVCTVISSATVGETPGPNTQIFVSPPVVSTLDGQVYFNAQSTGNIQNWLWNYGDGSSGTGQSSQHDYTTVGIYLVSITVTDNSGCTEIVTDTVHVKDYFTLYIPNAFTPNGNGLNDLFYPQGNNIDPDDYEFAIYDRWGNQVYYTKDINGKWNGTVLNKGKVPDDCVIGVYVYRVLAREKEGMEHIYIGNVTLIQ